jgi:hypothetical protein
LPGAGKGGAGFGAARAEDETVHYLRSRLSSRNFGLRARVFERRREMSAVSAICES